MRLFNILGMGGTGGTVMVILLVAGIIAEIYFRYRSKKNHSAEEKFLNEYVPSVKKVIERQVCDTSQAELIIVSPTVNYSGEKEKIYVYRTNTNHFFSVAINYYYSDIVALLSEDNIIKIFENQPERLSELGIKLN